MRHLVETIPGRYRTDPHRLEEDVVTWIPGQGAALSIDLSVAFGVLIRGQGERRGAGSLMVRRIQCVASDAPCSRRGSNPRPSVVLVERYGERKAATLSAPRPANCPSD
jgi:hypothetical protein